MIKKIKPRTTDERRKVLYDLIISGHYANAKQDELIRALKKRGYEVTQSTISKDLRALNIFRDRNEERYRLSDAPPKDILEKNLSDFYSSYTPTEPKKIVADLKICTLNVKAGYTDALAVEIKKYISDGRRPYYVQFLPMGDTLVMFYNDDGFIKELARVLDIQS